MIKVWILTVVFSTSAGSSSGGVSFSTEQYEYQSQTSCEVWRKHWLKQWKVGNAVCTQVELHK